jgi:toxin ParE1/3/4
VRIIVHPQAQIELVEAIEWMAERSPERAIAFRQAYTKAHRRISENPEWFPQVEPGIRRALIQRFRYSVLFALREDHALILVVMHQHRDPDYWRDRLR